MDIKVIFFVQGYGKKQLNFMGEVDWREARQKATSFVRKAIDIKRIDQGVKSIDIIIFLKKGDEKIFSNFTEIDLEGGSTAKLSRDAVAGLLYKAKMVLYMYKTISELEATIMINQVNISHLKQRIKEMQRL